MNAPHPLQDQLTVGQTPVLSPTEEGTDIDLLEYWDIVLDNRWLIGGIALLALAVGGMYAFLAKPVYEANLLIQVEDSAASAKSFLGEAASLFDVKTPATAEMELLRSRMVIGKAVDQTLLYIESRPRYLPFIGDWLARRAKGLSDPGLMGLGGWVTGKERINISEFDVPSEMESSSFVVTAGPNGDFTLSHSELDQNLKGHVGIALNAPVLGGAITLLVKEMEAKPGAQFELRRHSRLDIIERLQRNLKLTEKGRQSGVIDAALQDGNRDTLTRILNEIGQQYVRQNVDRKAAEAEKTLAFLEVQLPQFKKQLTLSEEAYNRYRNQQGTISLEEEAKLILTRSVELQSKLLEAQQRRREMISRFTADHPTVRTLDEQIGAWNREIAGLNSHVKGLPSVQQDALRLERDVKVNNELYQQLRNNALQLQLIREGKIGNVRLIDPAVLPEEAVRPKRLLIVSLALIFGLITGVLIALARNALFRGVRSPQEVEAQTGLNVYSTIPLSVAQQVVAKRVTDKQPGIHLLAHSSPEDVAVESLRSLRTALQFAMLEARNNRVLITGATPGVGKSFVSANFAAVLATAGKEVLLIDADLRKGHLNQYFGIGRAGGLSELIAGSIELEHAVRRRMLPNLDFISTGVLPPNPAELLASGAFANLLESLSAQYDLVIIDTAPVLAAADTLSVSNYAGTLLLVARADHTQLGELHESIRRLAHAGKSATGVLFNALDMTRRHYGSYSYKYGGYKYGGYKYRQYNYQAGGPQ